MSILRAFCVAVLFASALGVPAQTVGFTSAGTAVLENTGISSVNVLGINPSLVPVTASYQIIGGTADGSDFLMGAGALMFPANNTTIQSIPITINNDFVHEHNETVIVKIDSVSAGVISNDTYTLTIIDDDPAPTANFFFPFTQTNEWDGPISLLIILTGISQTDTILHISAHDGSAHQGVDYDLPQSDFTIPAGVPFGNIPIIIYDNNTYDLTHNFSITIDSATDGVVGAISLLNISVIDNDPFPTISSPVNQSIAENSTSHSLTVTLSNPSATTITVDYEAQPAFFNDPGHDRLSLTTGTLTFHPGESSASIPLNMHDDQIYTDDMLCYLHLSNQTNAALGNPTTLFAIIEDDVQPTVSFLPQTLMVNETASTATLQIQLTGTTTTLVGLSVDYATSSSTGAGFASAGLDYGTTTGTLTFSQIGETKTISIPIFGDNLIEGDERFYFVFKNQSIVAIDNAQTTNTIVDQGAAYGAVPTANIRDYLLGILTAGTGLDVNLDGRIDAADLIYNIRSVEPAAPSNPNPADGAMKVVVNTVFGCAPTTRATSYDLYLWKNGDAEPTTATQAGSLIPIGLHGTGDLDSTTTYHWRVAARNAAGATLGPIWTMTTSDRHAVGSPGIALDHAAAVLNRRE